MAAFKKIKLSQGRSAIVDAADFAWLSQWKWHANYSTSTGQFYAARRRGSERVSMHRAILGLTHGDGLSGDHINGRTLDNRKLNLRVATHGQNMRNRKLHRNNTTGCAGVRILASGRFQVRVHVDGAWRIVGLARSLRAAQQMRNISAAKHYGEFCPTKRK